MNSKPLYINKLVKLNKKITLNSGETVLVYCLSDNITDEEKDNFAKHILYHFDNEESIKHGMELNTLVREEYIKEYILPAIDLRNGSEVSGVFGEIIFSDFIEYILDYKVPRYKLYKTLPGNPNQGIDIVSYKFDVNNSSQDAVMFAETKSRLSCKSFLELQLAINDVGKRKEKDFTLALESARRKLELMGNVAEAIEISRFQDSEKPCKRIKAASLITTSNDCNTSEFWANGKCLGVNITNGNIIETHVIFGSDLMNLAKDLWRRACQ